MRVGGEFDRQVTHIHGTTIPLQPEAHLLLPHTIFRQRIGPQIVPLLTHLIAAFTHWPRLPPTQRLSRFSPCGLRQPGKEAIDASSVLDTPVGGGLQRTGLRVPVHET